MKSPTPEWVELVKQSLAGAGVVDRLEVGPAIVLSRIARDGGATDWFQVRSGDLDGLIPMLTPGARVSFYFDDRLSWVDMSAEVRSVVTEIARRTRDAIVARRDLGLRLEVEIVAGASDFDDYVGLSWAPQVLVGPFPAADNDGRDAITVILPDLDGVVRSHPH